MILKAIDILSSLVEVVRGQVSDDTIVILISFLYELDPTRGFF